MKTKEQIKEEVFNYLTKTSKHTFQYEDGKIFKVVKEGEDFFIIDDKSYTKVRKFDIDTNITYYSGNTKNVLKHSLFLNKNLKSIRTNKYTIQKVNDIFKPIKS
jgi:predicted GH43/DUF377 family glycosyl hydrolase